MAGDLVTAFYIGQSQVVVGTTTDMVAFATRDVFSQIWIGAEDKLPRRLYAVYLNDLARLRHVLELSNWELNTRSGGRIRFRENKQRPQNYKGHDRDNHHDIDQEIGQSAGGKTNSVRNQTSQQDSLSQ
jgi:hypothetical protein